MTTTAAPRTGSRGGGLGLALVSAASFSLSGTLASGLLETGWSPGAVVLVRIGLGALVVIPVGLLSLRGRWSALRANAGVVLLYGAFAVAGAQLAYFTAIERMPVGPALLVEYTAPAAVVAWMWMRHGQAPGRLTVLGAAIAVAGLVLVLDLVGGTHLDPVGVAWAFGAMFGAAVYFVVGAYDGEGLPPLALAAGGLVVGGALLGLAGAVGILPLAASTATPVYAGTAVPWWLPLLGLGVVTAGIAYVTGVLAARRLGARLSSFVGLVEVVAAVAVAWLLLGQAPAAVQLAGGALVLAGVAAVQAGEPRTPPAEPVGEMPA
ncbi:EamA family transporter [Xylanimonas sp. McL0601]|uniref:EamA family transporter n=1 Tax=Xylanimonas sp. McL0601 TaxID=3414739 RepID=UPI003CE9EF6D